MTQGPKDVHDELKHALRRVEPPAGFAERVLGRLGGQNVAKTKSLVRLKADPTTAHNGTHQWDPASAGLRRLPVMRLAAAATLVAALGGGIQYRAVQRERAEGEAAKAQVTLALHIASSKLQLVQAKINQLHDRPSEKNSNSNQ
jgi:hypothetical protein